MEEVLEVYHRPHDPACPLVCLDETSKQLIKETRVPIPARPGRPARPDYEYERNGTANIFMLFAPLDGGLSRDWGSCCDGWWRMRIVGGWEALPEAGAERAVIDGAADLEQPVGPAPGPAHLLRLGHAPVDKEIGRALGQ